MSDIRQRFQAQADAANKAGIERRTVGMAQMTGGSYAARASAFFGSVPGVVAGGAMALWGAANYRSGQKLQAKAERLQTRGKALSHLADRGRSRGFEAANSRFMAHSAQTTSSGPGVTGGEGSRVSDAGRGFANSKVQAAAQAARGRSFKGGGAT